MKIQKLFAVGIATVLLAIASLSFIADSPDSTGPGLRKYIAQDVADTVTSSTTFVSTDLSFAVAANSKYHVRYVVPITLAGTASGIKFQVNAPATPTNYSSSLTLFADDNSVGLVSVISSEAAQGVTLANAGNHWVLIEFDLINGSNAGTVALEFAQNVSDAGAAIVQRGAYAEVVQK